MTDQAKHDFSHDDLVSAMGHALRSVSIRLIACVGATETQSALFAEALSIAQGNMTHGEIAILLRGMADRIDSGELDDDPAKLH
jgi:hypothetical protein